MAREMTEREFRAWMRFAAEHWLPADRIEVYLAQIASVVAQTAGNDMSIPDFVLNFTGKKQKPPKDDVRAIAAMLPAVGVRKLGQGRKKELT
jgi:hypothetical protein